MNDSESQPGWNRHRKTCTIELIIAAACVIVTLIVPCGNMPCTVSVLAIIIAAWTLKRFFHASLVGVLSWGTTASIVTVFFWFSTSGLMEGLHPLPCIIAFITTISGLIAFLIAAWEDQRHRAVNCAGCMLILFTWVISANAATAISNYLDYREKVEKTTRTFITFHKLSAEIENIREHLGRLPTGEDELVKLRGQPMPTLCKDYRISYQRCSKTEYHLSCTFGDFWGYKWDLFGWKFFFYGPNSTQRVHAILF